MLCVHAVDILLCNLNCFYRLVNNLSLIPPERSTVKPSSTSDTSSAENSLAADRLTEKHGTMSSTSDRSSVENSLAADRLTEKLSSLLNKYDLRFPSLPDMPPTPEEVTYWTVVSAAVQNTQRLQPREPAHFKVHLTDVGQGAEVVCMSETCKIEGMLLDSTLTTVQHGGLVIVLAMNRKSSDLILKAGCSLCKFLVYKGKILEPTCNLPVVSVAGCADGTRTQALKSHITNGECIGGQKELLKQLQGYRQSIALAGQPCQDGHVYEFQLGRHLTALLH